MPPLPEERPVTFQSGALMLEGLLHLPAASPSPGLVVCHPHPMYGGDMRNNVVSALCRAAAESGLAALRFNFRGTGGSQGVFDNGRGEQDDVRAALAWLRSWPEVLPGQVALAGYSFGAAVALRSADSDIPALVLVSLPTLDEPPSDVAVACPVVLISGDRDEYSDPDSLRRLAEAIGGQAELVVLQGVDHFWWGSDDRLVEHVSRFLRSALALPEPRDAGRP